LGSTLALAGDYTIAAGLFFVGFAGVLLRYALDSLLCLLRSTLSHDFFMTFGRNGQLICQRLAGRDGTPQHVVYVANARWISSVLVRQYTIGRTDRVKRSALRWAHSFTSLHPEGALT
jgi:hypothetical protein